MPLTSIALALALSTTAGVEVTFTSPPPVVGDSCTTTTHTSMRFEGKDPAIMAVFGSERGGDKTMESTVLDVKDGVVTRERVRFLKANTYGLAGAGSERTTQSTAIDGKTFLFTRLDPAGHFTATREDGSPLGYEERELLKDELDQTEPELLTGRAMKLKQRLVFNRQETKKYFPFEGETGVEMRGFEMTLGAIENEGKAARVDVKFLFELQGHNGDAAITGWMTIHTDVDQRNQTAALEGPLRISLARPAVMLGPGTSEKVEAPHTVKGVFELSSQRTCAPR